MGIFTERISDIISENLTDVEYRKAALGSPHGKRLKDLGLKRNEIIQVAFPGGTTGFEPAPVRQQYAQRLADKVKELESQATAPEAPAATAEPAPADPAAPPSTAAPAQTTPEAPASPAEPEAPEVEEPGNTPYEMVDKLKSSTIPAEREKGEQIERINTWLKQIK